MRLYPSDAMFSELGNDEEVAAIENKDFEVSNYLASCLLQLNVLQGRQIYS